MSAKDTSGPAFPTADVWHPNGQIEYGSVGMSLRDYFAAKAMQGYIACGGATTPLDGAARPFNETEIAAGAYAVADAMLDARKL